MMTYKSSPPTNGEEQMAGQGIGRTKKPGLGEELIGLKPHPQDSAADRAKGIIKPRSAMRWLGKKPHRPGKTGFTDL
jgi:hypothetical protein